MISNILPAEVSIDDQIACAQRELELRRHVYPKRIAQGKMTQALADRETWRMRAILATLEKLKAAANPQMKLGV